MNYLAQTTVPASVIPEGKSTFAAVNASLNALSTVLLLAALYQVKRKRYRAHGTLMVTALVTSAVFLICYLTSYAVFGEVSTKRLVAVPTWARTVYLVVLFPHLLAAVGMLPMIFVAVNHAYHRRWMQHRRIARPTWYIWLYVSVTGVVVYWMLYHWLPSFK